MQIIETEIPEVKVLIPKRFEDERGYFSEIYNQRSLDELGLIDNFVQDNQSLSVSKGVVRGLHYQLPPMAQVKLLRVLSGAIRDIVLDIRPASPTFGRHVSIDMTAENGYQILIPTGFAHGFATLAPNTTVLYKVSAYYSPAHERGILWNDPALHVDWGVDETQAVLSERDRHHQTLEQAVACLASDQVPMQAFAPELQLFASVTHSGRPAAAATPARTSASSKG